MARAGYHTVRISHFYHHNAVVQILIQHDLFCFFRSHAFLSTKFHQFIDIGLGLVRFGRIHYHCTCDIQTFASFFHSFLAADQNYVCDIFFQNFLNGFIRSSVLCLRKNDCFFVSFCSFFDCVNKSHDL